MHIIGTAGHVDHGKSALVRALTGTDPDRWAEEQRRGMTLDLGFARLDLGAGIEAGMIDVPGHERFLHNMLAGAAGMELVLLVIAANEGPRAQTLEHLAILDYLAARSTLIVLTKSDTVDAAETERVTTRVRAAVAGTSAADAPLIAVSALTGAGLPALCDAIRAALIALPARAPGAPPYLPIDRVFALAGHGTVVTGTLMQGTIATGDVLALSPPGRGVRVRGVHVFGTPFERVSGGTRVALNLPNIDTAELSRGAVLASPQLAPAASFRVVFRALPAALGVLRRRTPVRAHIGAAEILGTLVFDRAPDGPAPVPAVLHLRAPTVVIPDMPFVVRRVSPMQLLGGGTLAAASAGEPTPSGEDVSPEVSADERERTAILVALVAAGPSGADAGQAGAAANIAEAGARTRLAELVADGRVRTLNKPPAFIAAQVADDLLARVVERLRERQAERPWLLGSTSIALAKAAAISESALVRVLAGCVENGALAYRGGYYSTLDFSPRLSPQQHAFFDKAFAAREAAGPAPIPFDELRAAIRASDVPELGPAFETLVAAGTLSKVADFVYRGAHIAAIRGQLESALRRNGHITVAEFRTLTGTSRKYAVPLLEFFDATGVTLRTGDLRVLRKTPARSGSA
jgi:selenocysteine-specific elongation factor